MAKCFSLWGPSRQELNSAEIFCSEPVAMIHVVITVTDLTRRGLFFDGHNRARAASRIVFVPRVLVSGLKLESWFWRCGRNESLPCVRMGTDMTSSCIQSCGRSLCLLRSRGRSPHGREGRGGGLVLVARQQTHQTSSGHGPFQGFRDPGRDVLGAA